MRYHLNIMENNYCILRIRKEVAVQNFVQLTLLSENRLDWYNGRDTSSITSSKMKFFKSNHLIIDNNRKNWIDWNSSKHGTSYTM